ncbi:glycoside hydrolase family 5 protein [Scatolibacter rhodanostii]|uniref:glycoside hydrolase family 5 protein n=1 Tax=Scatolibacter rhodanostii TaxID=2014781 RepID=UPI000C08AC9F|nr:cellulase family glycosylhydrolase [Scatolibacter rhodanostii]
MKQFVKAKDTRLYFGEKPLFLRGLGVGSWLNMEHFMLGIPTPDSMIRQSFTEVYGEENAENFFDDFFKSFLQAEDFQVLKDTGINFIRVPFNHRIFLNEQTGEYLEYGFAMMKRLLDFCEEYKIFVMPDLHTTPGGQNPDWHSDNRSGIPQFWEFAALRHQMTKLWGEIAKRFSSYEYLLGYDLLNEPSMASWEAMNSFYEETITEIRRYDTNHAIVLEGDMFAMDFSGLNHFDDSNIVLSFHYYPTVWNDKLLDKDMPREKRWEEFESGLLRLASIREQFKRPVICGEAGYDLHPDDMDFCMDLLEDTIAIFEKHEINWAIWTYKDAAFMGMVYPKSDTPWMQLAQKLREKWTHYKEMEQGKRMIHSAAEEFGGISENLAYKLQFRMRAILYEMQKEEILIPTLRDIPWEEIKTAPSSFLLENCEIWDCYQKLLQKFTQKN